MPRTNLLKKLCSCIKKTRKTVRVRKTVRSGKKRGSTKESAAIGICVKSVLQTRGKTLRKFSCGVKGKRKFLETKKLN